MKRTPLNKHLRRACWEMTDGRCWYCGCRLAPHTYHVDHMYPKSLGGTDDLYNLVPSCSSCNLLKGDRESFYEMSELIAERDFGIPPMTQELFSFLWNCEIDAPIVRYGLHGMALETELKAGLLIFKDEGRFGSTFKLIRDEQTKPHPVDWRSSPLARQISEALEIRRPFLEDGDVVWPPEVD